VYAAARRHDAAGGGTSQSRVGEVSGCESHATGRCKVIEKAECSPVHDLAVRAHDAKQWQPSLAWRTAGGHVLTTDVTRAP